MSIGEKRMGINLQNEVGSPAEEIQHLGARLINKINDLRSTAGTQEEIGEFKRLQATAMTDIEKGAMMGVKAATSK